MECRDPEPLCSSFLFSLRRRALRVFHIPQAPGARSARLAYAPCGAPARSRRPGRCAARSRSSPASWGRRGRGDVGGAGVLSPFFISLRRRALAPLAWLRAYRRAGAPARSRRPGRCAARSPLISRTLGPPAEGGRGRAPGASLFFHFPQARGARSARSRAPRAWTRDATRLAARRRAGRAAARPGPAHLPRLGAAGGGGRGRRRPWLPLRPRAPQGARAALMGIAALPGAVSSP